jgi:hypothetical protein
LFDYLVISSAKTLEWWNSGWQQVRSGLGKEPCFS